MKPISLFLLLVVFCCSPLWSNSVFVATATPEALYEGEVFDFSLTLVNREWGELELPDLSPFDIISGPGRSFRTSVVNGRTEQRVTYTYKLRAKKKGNYRIAPARMYTGGLILQTEPLDIMVLKDTERKEKGTDILVNVRLSCDTCYIGQQITMDIELYTRKRITDFALLKEPSFAGFQTRRLANIRNFQTARDTFQGRLYNKRVLRRYLLFPQQSGSFGGQEFDLRVVEEDQDPRWRGFFRLGGEIHYLSASVPDFWVLNKPKDAPKEFSGHIGNFELNIRSNRQNVRMGELLSATIVMRGDGDPVSMVPPGFDLSGGLHLSDIRLNREDITELDGRLRTTREWEVLFRADSAGDVSASAFIVPYHPELDSFYRIDGRPVFATVEKSEAGETVRHLDVFDNGVEGDKKRTFFQSLLFLIGTPLLLGTVFLLLFMVKKRRLVTADSNPSQRLRKSLEKSNRSKFSSEKDFCSHLLQTLDVYLAANTTLPMSEWNEESLRGELLKSLSENEVDKLLKVRTNLIAGTFGYAPVEAEEARKILLEITESIN